MSLTPVTNHVSKLHPSLQGATPCFNDAHLPEAATRHDSPRETLMRLVNQLTTQLSITELMDLKQALTILIKDISKNQIRELTVHLKKELDEVLKEIVKKKTREFELEFKKELGGLIEEIAKNKARNLKPEDRALLAENIRRLLGREMMRAEHPTSHAAFISKLNQKVLKEHLKGQVLNVTNNVMDILGKNTGTASLVQLGFMGKALEHKASEQLEDELLASVHANELAQISPRIAPKLVADGLNAVARETVQLATMAKAA
ncbi:MAG: hypothetical protein C5B47_01905 [Verrucomicrobia bacterium]|nr:MAG: hypothetical protein C5B47_01905 [Verrucomicrobiota bacterium]